MGFERWGFQQAQPIFQEYEKYDGSVQERKSKGMIKAIELSKWNQTYRSDDGWIDHPDAELIAHSQDDISFLLSEIKRVTAERDAAVNELSALKEANQWISVEERFPEPYVRKLVKLLTGFVGCASYSNLSERWLPDSGQPIKTISAWRDLPEVSESEE